MIRMLITLDDDERQALIRCAKHERRDVHHQAAIIIRCELKRLGLLSLEDGAGDNRPTKVQRATD